MIAAQPTTISATGMAARVSARDLKAWLSDGGEIALLDVREHGQYGEGHPFFAVPCAYSVFEHRLPTIAPNLQVRLVLLDDGDGIAERAANRAGGLGYTDISILDGGAPAWAAAGFTLYKGVNVPSKTFGELLEEARHTPRLTADEVAALAGSGDDFIIVDGRPFEEYSRFNIPGGVCCPNGELALRIGALAPDPATTVVVNCAGRTRSILGAQTLIDFGIPNPVYALENGTQGWFLAGREVERGANRTVTAEPPADLDQRRAAARAFAERHGVPFVGSNRVAGFLQDEGRTLYVLDVRTAEEFAADGLAGSVHAPGGQLVQATDQWIAVRNARVVLVDGEMVRAPVVAGWLRAMGHDAMVLDGGIAAASAIADALSARLGSQPAVMPPDMPVAPPMIAPAAVELQKMQLVDVRGSMAHRAGHIEGARWGIRPHLDRLELQPGTPVVLIGDDAACVALAARDLGDTGFTDVSWLSGGPEDWTSAGLAVVASPTPADGDCIDHLFFTATRHQGDEVAARQYLEWEIGLVGQLDDQERAVFRL